MVNTFSSSRIKILLRDCIRLSLRAAILSAGLVLLTLPAFAGLGDDASAIQADQAHMQGALRTTQTASFTVHEIKTPSGITVREYVSADGKVFGVAWQGPWLPDMRQLLSSYFETYRQASQAEASSHAGRRPLVIDRPELVVQSGGHIRSFMGKAYVPAMLPAGVSAEAIQ
jgi:Protein of unknown function (DUF2844)